MGERAYEQRYPPISAYALLSDCHSSALVSREGSIDWCCIQRFDGNPIFSRILDWERGGYFRVAPCGISASTRQYKPGTNILITRFETETGAITVTDLLPVRRSRPDGSGTVRPHEYDQIIRIVEGVEGEVDVEVRFAPRFDFGLTIPRVEIVDERLAVTFGGPDALIYQSEWPIRRTQGHECISVARIVKGERRRLIVSYTQPHELAPRTFERDEIDRRFEDTCEFWEEWSNRCAYEGPYREQVLRSALVLKGLTHSDTGAIIAAPTTSLPEEIGGVRNWDYRYTWLRDSAWILESLFGLGYREEADAFRRFIWRTTAGRADDLQLMYGIGGERLLPEVRLNHMDGYRGSRPVRIGNEASKQFQLDIPGEMLDLAWLFHKYGGVIDLGFWEFLVGIVEFVEKNWTRPDSSLWEVRGAPRHFVHSKVMCWVAVDRAVQLARTTGFPAPVAHWKALKNQIRHRIEQEGVHPDKGFFVQSFGGQAVDAAGLMLPLEGFVAPDDPRVRATVREIETRLVQDGLVKRYLTDDGLPGEEGFFLICSFWLVENYAVLGETDRAIELFEHLLGFANDVGLLAEEVDGVTGGLLGNFPQGFSHLGLISAASTLAARSRGEAPLSVHSTAKRNSAA